MIDTIKIMKRYMMATGALCAIFGTATSAQVADQGVLQSHFIPALIYVDDAKSHQEGAVLKASSEHFETLSLQWKNLGVRFEDLTIVKSDAGFKVSSGKVVINSVDGAGAMVVLSGLALTLNPSFIWASPDQLGCAYLDALNEISVQKLTIDGATSAGSGLASISIDKLTHKSDASGKCRLSGASAITDLLVRESSGASVVMNDLTMHVNFPITPEVVTVAGQSHINVAVGQLSLRSADGTVSSKFTLPVVRADFDDVSIKPALQVLGGINIFQERDTSSILWKNLWNAATVVDAGFTVIPGTVQTVSAAVVPTRMTADFSKVGMSSITTTGAAGLEFRHGDVKIKASSSHTGLGAATLAMSLRMEPYSQMAARLTGGPDIRIENVAFTWTDAGLIQVFTSLFGLPPDSWIIRKEADAVTEDQGSPGLLKSYSELMLSFIRKAETGKPAGLTLSPASPANAWRAARAISLEPQVFLKIMKPKIQ